MGKSQRYASVYSVGISDFANSDTDRYQYGGLAEDKDDLNELISLLHTSTRILIRKEDFDELYRLGRKPVGINARPCKLKITFRATYSYAC